MNVRVLTIKVCFNRKFYSERNKMCVCLCVCVLYSNGNGNRFIFIHNSLVAFNMWDNGSISSEYLSTFVHSTHELYFYFQIINLQAQINLNNFHSRASKFIFLYGCGRNSPGSFYENPYFWNFKFI